MIAQSLRYDKRRTWTSDAKQNGPMETLFSFIWGLLRANEKVHNQLRLQLQREPCGDATSEVTHALVSLNTIKRNKREILEALSNGLSGKHVLTMAVLTTALPCPEIRPGNDLRAESTNVYVQKPLSRK